MTAKDPAAAGEFSPLSPPSGRFWITDDSLRKDRSGNEKPTFSTSVVASGFFGRSAAWLRVKMRPSDGSPSGKLVLDGAPLDIRRSDADDRQFSLYDIERIAHALYQGKIIDRDRFACAIMMVVACGVSYRILPRPWPYPPGDEEGEET